MTRLLLLSVMAMIVSPVVAQDSDLVSQSREPRALRPQSSATSSAAAAHPAPARAAATQHYVTKFEAPWCPACRTEPISKWLKKAGWTVVPVNADADGDGDIDAEYGDVRLPTFIVTLNGQEAARYTGTNKAAFANIINQAKGRITTTVSTTTTATAMPAEAAATPYSEIARAFGDDHRDDRTGDTSTMNFEDTWPLRDKVEGLIISLRFFLDIELKTDKPMDNEDRLALLDICDWIESDLGISSGPLPME